MPAWSRSRSSRSRAGLASGRSRPARVRGLAQADDQRDGDRPAPQPALVAAAVEQRRQPHLRVAAADVQGADPFRAVNLVRGEAEQVDPRRPGRRAGPCRRPGWRRCGRGCPASWQSRPIAAIGLSVPTSLLAAMTETRTVRSVSAAAIASAETRPCSSQGTIVRSHPSRAAASSGRARPCARSRR